MAPSCYILELSVSPGRARRGDVFVYSRLAHIRRCLEQEFLAPDVESRRYVASLAVQGATVALWVVEEGKLVRGVDLRRHIRMRLGADAPIALGATDDRDDAWKDQIASAETIEFTVDWDSIARESPTLRGAPLQRGETVQVDRDDEVLANFDSYLEIVDDFTYGYEDLDGGTSAPLDFVDPDPPPDQP